MDRLSDYDYELPRELIAHAPAERRDEARLMIVHRDSGEIEHQRVRDLPQWLHRNDALVLNDTRVLPARLRGFRTATGGQWEGLFLRNTPAGWELLSKTRGKLQAGETVTLQRESASYVLTLSDYLEEGKWLATPQDDRSITSVLDEFGEVPLPPYIEPTADVDHESRYQTVFAQHAGSVAAPTAGLHFTPELLTRIENAGAIIAQVTLHVGIGTFRPIEVDSLSEHAMHAEWCCVSNATSDDLSNCRKAGGRIVAVGTTSTRTLESANGKPFEGETSLFIRPPYRFRHVDAMVTNFHLPKSSLLVMISAFAGRELVQRAYQEAIARKYRFFSYGDAMLIL